MIERAYDIDLIPGGDPVEIRLSQYDTDFQILLYLTATNGNFVIENGTTAQMRGTKPDGSAYTKGVYMTGRSVILQGDENLTDVAGIGIYEICLTHNNKLLNTSNFRVKVEPSPAERD